METGGGKYSVRFAVKSTALSSTTSSQVSSLSIVPEEFLWILQFCLQKCIMLLYVLDEFFHFSDLQCVPLNHLFQPKHLFKCDCVYMFFFVWLSLSYLFQSLCGIYPSICQAANQYWFRRPYAILMSTSISPGSINGSTPRGDWGLSKLGQRCWYLLCWLINFSSWQISIQEQLELKLA